MADAKDVSTLLEERPDLESAVEEVLEPEAPWSFEDVDVDSGAFGELVSCGIVEDCGDGYRVSDSDTVRAVLENPDTDPRNQRDDTSRAGVSLEGPALSWHTGVGVAGALVLVALLRLTSLSNVFQDGDTVLSGNDPYYYRYWIERILSSERFGLTALPKAVARGEPLFVATLQVIADLVGGTPEAIALVMAWYPVVAAVLTATVVYTLLTTISTDRRVAVAAVIMFALTPGHAFRTSLGFADHHAFDYVWLTVTAIAVTVLTIETIHGDTPRVGRIIAGVLTLAAGVTGQTLAWDAGPLLLLPVGGYLAVDSLLAVYTSRSPARTAIPILVGIGLGTVITWTTHTTLGWHRMLVAASPGLLFAGGAAVTIIGEVSYRLDLHVGIPTVVELVGGFAALTILSDRYPEQWTQIVRDVETRFFRIDTIAETGGLFSDSFGWLLLFGFVFILAVPYLLLATQRATNHPRWVPLVIYTWYFTGLAVVQIRFVGQMAPFVAVFAGIGFVHLAEWVDIIDDPPKLFGDTHETVRNLTIPSRGTLQSLFILFLLVGSLSFIQIPIKTSQLTHSDAQYQTASWMANSAADRGLEYPDSYVFSQWGDNRFYNYFVNGESRSYGVAKANYEAFVFSTDSGRWYDRLRGRTGFIVVTPAVVGNASTIGTRLYQTDASRTEAAPGLVHYRLVYVSDNEQYKVFTLVSSATITGTGPANETLTVRTDVTIGTYTTTYERRIETGPNGTYSVTVPYPGEYRVAGDSVKVTESDIQNGTTVTVE